jgi:hypothetical protein
MRNKAVQQGRSEGRGESYSGPYVEPLSDARTPLAVLFRILINQLILDPCATTIFCSIAASHLLDRFQSEPDSLVSQQT